MIWSKHSIGLQSYDGMVDLLVKIVPVGIG